MASSAAPPPTPATATERIRNAGWVASLAVVVCVVFFLALGGSQRDFRVPIAFFGDSLYPEALIKSVADHGWWWHNPSLSAPFTFDAVSFPANSNVDFGIVWILSWVFHDIGRLVNFTWLAFLILGGCIAATAMRQLGVSRLSAWVIGLLYAFAPYALYRHVDHFILGIHLVPIPAIAAVLCASGRAPSRRTRLFLFSGCVLIGFNYVYYAFFATFFLAAAAAIGFFNNRDFRSVRLAGICAGLIMIATAVNLAPSMITWAKHGRPDAIQKKTAAEADIYGLKLRHLIGPLFDHSLRPFRSWTALESEAGFPWETENKSSRLGVVATLGFLGLLGCLFWVRCSTTSGTSLILSSSHLTLAGLMLATVGGFGSLFALFVSPDIRAYNRITPFLAFFALLAIGLGLDRLRRAAAVKYRRPAIGVVAAAVVCVFGLWDQLHAFHGLNVAYPSFRAEFAAVHDAVTRLEAVLPRDSMVFQVPFRSFPADMGGQLPPYLHFRPYLVSHTLRWSYPAMSNEQVRYQANLETLPIPELLTRLKQDGFAALMVDRRGYTNGGAEIITQVEQALGSNSMVVSVPSYIVYDIRNAKPTTAAQP